MSEPTEPLVSADGLSDVLRAAGALTAGTVDAVEVISCKETLLSTVSRIVVRYSDAGTAPQRFFLKSSRRHEVPELARWGIHEVAFYRDIAPRLPVGLVPRCYEAVWDEAAGSFRLLLEDLTETHAVISEWPMPPTDEQCRRIVTVYARLHAAFWDHAELGTTIGTPTSEAASTTDWRDRYARRYGAFADALADRLSTERRRGYERVIPALGGLVGDRHRARKHLTIAHGDAHVWNALHAPGGDMRIIDWDSWSVDTATDDLAYMMAVHWYPNRRRRLEGVLLHHYHDALVTAGVRGYSLEALWRAYRLSVLKQLEVPVFQHAVKLPAVIWWGHLERIMLAFDDLGCEELLP